MSVEMHDDHSIGTYTAGEVVSTDTLKIEKLPAEQFGDHVDYVRQNGDVLDLTEWYDSYKPAIGRIACVSAVGITASGPLLHAAPISTLLSMWVVGAGMTWRAKRRLVTEEGEEMLRRGFESVRSLDEAYELYRVEDKITKSTEIVMRWYGADRGSDDIDAEYKTRPLADSLALMADLAEAHDIKAIFVPNHILEKRLPTAKRMASDTISMQKWLRDHKGVNRVTFIDEDQKEVDATSLVYTPQQLKIVAKDAGWVEHTPDSVYAVMEILRARNPHHPLVRVYDAYEHVESELSNRLKRTARKSLERNLDEVALQFAMTRQGTPSREKVYKHGAVIGDTVEWRTPGKASDHETLLSALGLHEEQVTDILVRPTQYTTAEVTRAAEYAVYTNIIAPQRLKPKGGDIASPRDIYPLQATILAMYQSTGTRLTGEAERAEGIRVTPSRGISLHAKMQARTLGVALAAAGTLFVGGPRLDNVAFDEGVRRQIPLAQSYTAVREATAQFAPMLDAFESSILPGGDSPHDNTPHDQGASNISTRSIEQSPVTNVEHDAHASTPEWNLKSIGGMSTAGYWATDTGTYFDGQNWTGLILDDGRNIKSAKAAPASLDAGIKDYIESSRTIQSDELIPANAEYMIRIPVRAQTQPRAAQIDGMAVTIVERINGTYALDISSRQHAKLSERPTVTYWLTPDKSAKLTASMQSIDPEHRNSDENIKAAWDAAQPNLPAITDGFSKRLDAEVAHLQKNFKYSYKPFSKQFQERLQNQEISPDELVREILENKLANCNAAATVVALDNPSLNPAWGYRNDGDMNLQGSESHMWDIDERGEIFDPTPLVMDDKSSHLADVLTVAYKGGLGLGGVLLLGGVSKYGRRKLRQPLARAQLSRYSAAELLTAKHVTDSVNYAKEFNTDTLPVVAPGVAREEVLKKVGKPHLHTARVTQNIQIALQRAKTAEEGKLLSKAARILGVVKKAGHVQPLGTKDDLGGVV